MNTNNLRDNPIIVITLLGIFAYYYITRYKVDDSVIKKFDKITLRHSEISRYYEYYKSVFKDSNNSDFFFRNLAYHKTIEDYAIINECLKFGIEISDQMITDEILIDKRFLTNNSFDKIKFENHLKNLNLTEIEYRKLRKAGLYKKYWRYIIKKLSTAKLDKEFVNNYLIGKNEKRSGKYLKISKKKIDLPEPSKEELMDFFNKNKHKYKVNDIHKFHVLKMKNKDYKMLEKDENNKEISLLNIFINENNYNWLIKNYKFLKADMDTEQVNLFINDDIINHKYEKSFLQNLIKVNANLPLNKCSQTFSDKFNNIYIFYCYDIQKKETNFEDVKKEIINEWKKNKYLEYIKNSQEEMTYIEEVQLLENSNAITEFLFENYLELNKPEYYQDNNYVYKIILTNKTRKNNFTNEEFEIAYKHLYSQITNEAIKSAKKSLAKKHEYNQI